MRRVPNSALVAGFTAVIVTLLVLAVMQYRWIIQASAMEQRRMEEILRTAGVRFSEDLSREIARLASTFSLRDMPSTDRITEIYSDRLQQWMSGSRFPGLLKDLLLARIDGTRAITLLRYDPQSRMIERAEWPGELHAFHQHAMAESVRVKSPEAFKGPPSREPAVAHLPAIAGPIFDSRISRDVQGWQIVRINSDALKTLLLPELVATHFPSTDDAAYDVLITDSMEGSILFASSPVLLPSSFTQDNASVISIPGMGGPPHRPGGGFGPPPARGGWRLYVRYQGGVPTFVNNVRRTNLAVSFGLLVVLGGVIAFTLLYTERVRALGKMQMEFAAGLSHELRTPLTAIRSAAYNMIVGNVSGKEDIAKYGRVLHEQGVRFSEMVEQALTFAQTQSGKEKYTIAPTDVASVVKRTINTFRSLHPEAPCEIVTDIHQDLPHGMTDAAAVTLCLQNLLTNAMKYGSEGKQVRVDARRNLDTADEIEITVEDYGPGIDRSDLPHIFEPFFRGKNAGSAHGNGLGLYLAKHTIESAGGRLAVVTSQNGSRFTLFIRGVGAAINVP